jgi:hypothetical protein
LIVRGLARQRCELADRPDGRPNGLGLTDNWLSPQRPVRGR